VLNERATIMTEVDRGSDRPRGRVVSRFGFWIAIATSATTLLTFVLALTALPNKVPYPFTDDVIADQWPGDYLWMFPAMVLMVLFVALVAVLHVHAPQERNVFSLLALGIAVISAAVLLIDYYIQATVMQLSLEKGQLDGWALFTQYNPNGVFIALEELGYLLMSLVFLSLVPIFVRGSGVRRAIRWLFLLSFAATMLALVAVSVVLGIDRGDVFEIALISIVWLTLISVGPLLAVLFRREGLQGNSSSAAE
jgi:hypothetical protein